jgi:hypothetical protein
LQARVVGALHRLPLPDPSQPPALPSRLRAWAAAAASAADKLTADAAAAASEAAAEAAAALPGAGANAAAAQLGSGRGAGGAVESPQDALQRDAARAARAARARRGLLCAACEPGRLASVEVPWLLRDVLEPLHSPVVLCHNDLHVRAWRLFE